jgi:HAD superfamily hydrolase (TIGR01450 family)
MGESPMMTAPAIFERYQQVRHRIPDAQTPDITKDIDTILKVTGEVSAFVFDAFGVLNVGDKLIDGADERLQQLRDRGSLIRVLTNAASYDRDGAIEKFSRLGLPLLDNEIITSRQAAVASLTEHRWGVIATRADTLGDLGVEWIRLADTQRDYDRVEGFLFLSSAEWNTERQAILTRSLLQQPRPVVIANADLVAPRGDSFSLEPGHYGHLLVDSGVSTVRFFGKPFPEVYELVERTLPDVATHRIAMCGDTLHTDIIGAAARGWRTVLVTRDGLFAGHDTQTFCEQAALFPTWRTPRI